MPDLSDPVVFDDPHVPEKHAGDYGLAVCLEAGAMAVFQLQGGYGKGRLACLLQEHVSCYGDYRGDQLVLNSMAGYGFARIPFRGRNTLFFFALTGMMAAAADHHDPCFYQSEKFPLVGGNDILGHGGSGMINTYAGLILPYIAGAFGVFLCRQFYMNFPVSLDDAAKIDGCSRFMAYFRIYLPLSKPILATLAVLKASQTWNDYLWPLIMVNKDETMTVQLAVVSEIYDGIFDPVEFADGRNSAHHSSAAGSVYFTQKYFVEGIVTTGMKG